MRCKKGPEPKVREERIIKEFLFLPKTLDNEVRFLETALIRQI